MNRKKLSLKAKRKAAAKAAAAAAAADTAKIIGAVPAISLTSPCNEIDLTVSTNHINQAVIRSGFTSNKSKAQPPPRKKQKKKNNSTALNQKRSNTKLSSLRFSKSSTSSYSNKSLLEKLPKYEIINIKVPNEDMKKFDKSLFTSQMTIDLQKDKNDNNDNNDEKEETTTNNDVAEEHTSTVLPHCSESFEQHQKYGYPEVLLTWNNL